MTDEARIKARYPRRTATDYLLFGVALAVLIGTIVFVAISGVQRSNPPVAAMVRSFDVISPTEIQAEIVVQRTTPSDAAECAMFAQALSYEKVAETMVEIPPGTEKLTAITVSLNTIKEPASISIEGCRIVG
ncbi:DUF4307 domain-containing protein [Tessaracoccus caeni]|uniref:DUF4307 domain-containing protein n=1 Tax=Tessaracoccus caeni TaxID=3031239 RepID=UPI0023DC8C90|nr:DUF4307 domain-containing protein [Tessaracoccus caeni]MDF1489133.1 DUF4307 domain-containing protein [Tessaracoccus caeni]